MAEDAVATDASRNDQTSGNTLELKLVPAPGTNATACSKTANKDGRLDAADDVDDIWDNVPI